ncbi:Spb1 C-terminal domain-containing protein [Mrakia frigida]|uniref:27S pre-rRNA (guanosine2922-2'-O)-methyltransferase n=1 Tax=Mrakia frigida TaxID=29902 RepID=UPI003FCC1833
MGKDNKKTGKGRLDKYYKLAKEQGYRARSAFKLIQLNKKYDLLGSSKVCIDLCAAPGGWLQVAARYMPVGSLIVGVDLDPIRPLPSVISFVSDITTAHCRQQLRSHLHDWKADIVLHDGAPNVGTAWVHDAYGQSELVLMSLKLAVDFLRRGGTFVTKVFRSGDYNSLMWVFGQLFGKVEATKPPSSRNVSAEIFVVCRDFLAPAHIDPKFLDPRHVFKDLSSLMTLNEKGTSAGNAHANVFAPEKKRRKREGYEDGALTLFKEIGVSEFVNSQDPVMTLGTVNRMTFKDPEEKAWLKSEHTTGDVKSNLEDLKVLGKGDFKALIKWRMAIREEIGLDVKHKPVDDHTEAAVVEEQDEDEQIEEELGRLTTEAAKRARQDRRKAQEKKMRAVTRMQLRMTAPTADGLELEDKALHGEEFFDLGEGERGVKGHKKDLVSTLDNEGMSGSDSEDNAGPSKPQEAEEFLDSEDEREAKTKGLETELDGLYDDYRDRMQSRDNKFRVKEARMRDKTRESWKGITAPGSDDEEEDEEDGEEGGWEKKQENRAKIGEEPDSSDDSSDEEGGMSEGEDDDEEEGVAGPSSRPATGSKRVRGGGSLLTKLGADQEEISSAAKVWFDQPVFKGLEEFDDLDEDEDDEEEEEEMPSESSEESEIEEEEVTDFVVSFQAVGSDSDSDGGFEIVPADRDDDEAGLWDVEDEDQDEIKRTRVRDRGLNTAEAITLASQLVNREKTLTQLVNDGFTRHTFDSKDDLPHWFLDDETKHYKSNVPITKEAVEALKAKQRALDARPIRKIAEAKARKQRRAAIRMEKALKKADGIVNNDDVTERQKAGQVEKVMRKGLAKDQRRPLKIVVATGTNRGVKGRPKGVKGRYKMLDSRDRKELRAKKRREKAGKPNGGRKKKQ